MTRRLKLLLRWTGNPHADGMFKFALMKADVGFAEREKDRKWRHAYLGRYMGLTVTEIESMSAAAVLDYIAAVSAIVKRENEPPAPAGTMKL